jgi:replication factor A1
MSNEANEIYKKLQENGIVVPISEIEESINKMIAIGLSRENACKTVMTNIARKHGTELSPSASQTVTIAEIFDMPAGAWVNLKVNVKSLAVDSDKYNQRGIIGDETGTISFISSKNTPFKLEAGKSYILQDIVTGQFNKQPQVSLNKNSKETLLTETIEAKEFVKPLEGKIVAVMPGSGLIKRCPECNSALTKGACMKHGKVNGNHDLRIKAILDNGETTENILISRELTESFTGIDLQKAIAIAADTLDAGSVKEQMAKMICNRYYRIHATPLGDNMLARNIEPLAGAMHNPLNAKSLL